MEITLTGNDKKIITMGLFTLYQMLEGKHPEAEIEIEDTAKKLGVIEGVHKMKALYGGFNKMMEKMRELGNDLEGHDKEMVDLLKNATKSQDKPDLN